jgi:hypothetical protein
MWGRSGHGKAPVIENRAHYPGEVTVIEAHNLCCVNQELPEFPKRCFKMKFDTELEWQEALDHRFHCASLTNAMRLTGRAE